MFQLLKDWMSCFLPCAAKKKKSRAKTELIFDGNVVKVFHLILNVRKDREYCLPVGFLYYICEGQHYLLACQCYAPKMEVAQETCSIYKGETRLEFVKKEFYLFVLVFFPTAWKKQQAQSLS